MSNASAQPAPHMSGNYAPVAEELTTIDLPVSGHLPKALTGWYLRNGPNPHAAVSAHWFLGDGMIHGVRLEGGRAVWYRNRWVRTSTFTDGARVHDGSGHRDLRAGVANTHVVQHAGRTLALVESSLPQQITCDLETIGPYDFDGALATSMTAHPKICPITGELHFFGSSGPTPPSLTYHRAGADGVLQMSVPVGVPAHTMMHDFALSAGHVIFMDLPVVFDQAIAQAGAGMPYQWDDNYGARLGVLRRDDPTAPVRWFDIDPCYVFHVLNAHDEDGRVVLHVMRYPELFRKDGGSGQPATLWRWTIDLATGTVAEQQFDDRPGEFPRIDDRLAGLPARYGYVVASSPASEGGEAARRGALHRYDLTTGAVCTHDFGLGRIPDEAAFAAGDGDAGWLLTYVYDAATDRSELVVLDAHDLAAAPVASVHLPARVPYGFHGNWLPDGP